MRQVTTEQKGASWIVKVDGVIVADEPTRFHADSRANELRADRRGEMPVVPVVIEDVRPEPEPEPEPEPAPKKRASRARKYRARKPRAKK